MEEVFIYQPPGFEKESTTGDKLVCKLKEALYGLKQAPRAWFEKLMEFLCQHDLRQSQADVALFIRGISGKKIGRDCDYRR